jgi:autotransporter-associated beta strand protein
VKIHKNKIQGSLPLDIKKRMQMLAVGLTVVVGMAAARADILTWDPLLNGGGGGTGTWNLNGTANWWNGGADVKWLDTSANSTNSAVFAGTAGTVTLNSSLSASNLQFFAAGYTLSGSGTLTLGAGGIDGSNLGSDTTTIGVALSLFNQQQWLAGAGSTLAINGAVTRNTGGAIDFSPTGVKNSAFVNDATGIIGGWATVGGVNSTAGDWAANDGSGNIIAYTGYTAVSSLGNTSPDLTGSATQNWLSGDPTGAANFISSITNTATLNSLVAMGDVNLANGTNKTTLTLNSGGLILRGVSRWLLAGTNSFLTTGNPTGELFVHAPNPSSTLDWTIWPIITDNGATPLILVKDGADEVKLGNMSTYTGGTIVNAGILASRAGAANPNGFAPLGVITPFGLGPITVRNGAQLQLGSNPGNAFGEYDYPNDIFADNALIYARDGFHHIKGTLNVGAGGAALGATYDNKGDALNAGFAKGLFVDGLLAGSGPLAIQDSGLEAVNPWDSSTVYFMNMGTPDQNTYNGTVTINSWPSLGGSYLYLVGTNALANATININGDNDANAGRFGSSALLFGSGTSVDGPGYATIGALTGNGSFVLQNTKTVQNGSSLGAAVTLTIGNNNASTTYAGTMSGSGGIVKIGNGTLTLASGQSYTGDTVLSGGSIVLSAGWLSSSNVIVGAGRTLTFTTISPIGTAAGQILWGSGTYGGSITASTGSGISAGTDGTYGTNTITGDLSMASGASGYFDLTGSATGANDRVNVNGVLTANNNVIHVKVPDTSVNLDTTTDYVLFSSPNNISGTFATAPTWDVAPANAAHFSIVTGAKTVTLHYSAIAGPTGIGSATPSPAVRNQNVLIKVIASNGSAGTVNNVVVDASSIGGSASLNLVNNGANVWTNTVTIPTDLTTGNKLLVATVSDTAALSAFVNIPLSVVTGSDVWNGLGADDNLSTSLNWTNQTAPALVGDSLQFAGSTRLTPNVDNGYIVTGVLFRTNAGAFNISSTGNTLTLTNGTGVVNNSANLETISAPISIIGPTFFNAAVGNLNLAGPIAVNDNTLMGVTGSTNTLISGGVSGNGSLFKQGTGSLTISSGTSWSGNQASSGGFNGPLIDQSGTLTFNNGSAHNVTGELVIGGVVTNGGPGNNAKMIVDNANLNISTWLSVGRGNGTGTVSSDLILTNNAVVSAQNMSAGYNGNSLSNAPKGSVTLSDTSTLSISGGTLYVGESDHSDMTMNVNGTATVTAPNATMTVGANSGKGTLNINGGSVSVGSLRLGSGANLNSTAQGIATINSGTLSSEGDINLGFAGSGAGGNIGKLVINGGTVNMATATLRWFIMGQWDTAASEVDMNAGNLNINANSSMRFAINGNNGTNVFNLNGGALTFYSDNASTVGGTGVLDLHQGNGATVQNTFNLNGGTLSVSGILTANASGTRTFNFNGGTLKAVADNVSFMNLGTGNTAANVRNGGAIFDTAGFNVTVPQNLQHSVVSGDNSTDGGLTKLGNGILVLSGTNSYNGKTVVNAGILEIAQPTLGIASTVYVTNNATLQLDFAVTNRVSGLVLNGVSQPQGVYSATTSPTYISGTGSLLVGPAIASNPTNITVSVTGAGSIGISWPADHLGWVLQRATNSMTAPVWTDVAGSDTSTSNNVPINPAIPNSFFRLRHP